MKDNIKNIFTASSITLVLQSYTGYMNNDPLILLLSCVVLVTVLYMISAWTKWFSPSLPCISEGKALIQNRKGIIFTLGRYSHRKNSPLLKVLQRQKPQFCGFLGTIETSQSKAVDQIVELARLNAAEIKEEINSPVDMEATRAATIKLIEWMLEKKLQPQDIVVDVTGGMVPMSLGAYMAANEMGVDVQYVASEFGDDNKPIEGTQKALLIEM